MLGFVNVSGPSAYPGPGGRSAWNTSRPAIRKPLPAERIEGRIGQAHSTEPATFKPVFPFPLDGPLMPAPADRAASRQAFAQAKRALGATTKELAGYFGLKWRTVQNWERGRNLIDPMAWTLIQIAVRAPEARRLLRGQAQG